jgi:hypothetical protein
MLKKARTLIAALVVFSFLGWVAPAQALDRDHDRKCEQQIRNAERKHGEHSRQAQSRRRDLENVRARCHRGDHDHDHR